MCENLKVLSEYILPMTYYNHTQYNGTFLQKVPQISNLVRTYRGLRKNNIAQIMGPIVLYV